MFSRSRVALPLPCRPPAPVSVCLIAGLGLLFPHPAAAQNTLSLQSGDNVTVSGTGTTGTYQGQPIPPGNTTSSYSTTATSANTVFADSNSTLTLQNGSALSASGNASFALHAVNNTVAIIGGNIINTGGIVSLTPSPFSAFERSVGFGAFGSNVSVTGGAISDSGDDCFAMEVVGGTVTINDGTITSNGNGLNAAGLVVSNSVLTLTGGTISAVDNGITATGLSIGNSTATISGGTVSGGFSSSGSTVAITGGTFDSVHAGGTGIVSVTGGMMSSLLTNYGGTIDLFGTFNQTSPITSGSNNFVSGNIIGTLLNGQPINASYDVYQGTIEFNVGTPPAPEPSQTVALGVGVLALAGLCARGRRRAAAV